MPSNASLAHECRPRRFGRRGFRWRRQRCPVPSTGGVASRAAGRRPLQSPASRRRERCRRGFCSPSARNARSSGTGNALRPYRRTRPGGANLEAMARQHRYDWLGRIAGGGSPWMATGHTADDQAETVLHRLLPRGTGLQGLRGIASGPADPPGREVVRPLLKVPRSNVLAYLGALGQPYREDSSNADVTYTVQSHSSRVVAAPGRALQPGGGQGAGSAGSASGGAFPEIEGVAGRTGERRRIAPARGKCWFSTAGAPRHRRTGSRETFRLAWDAKAYRGGDFRARTSGTGLPRWPAANNGVDLPGGIRAHCRERVVQVGPIR